MRTPNLNQSIKCLFHSDNNCSITLGDLTVRSVLVIFDSTAVDTENTTGSIRTMIVVEILKIDCFKIPQFCINDSTLFPFQTFLCFLCLVETSNFFLQDFFLFHKKKSSVVFFQVFVKIILHVRILLQLGFFFLCFLHSLIPFRLEVLMHTCNKRGVCCCTIDICNIGKLDGNFHLRIVRILN